jgi:hypothetical protein
MMICLRIVLLTGSVLVCVSPLIAQTGPAPAKYPAVPIMGSELRSLASKDTGRSYDLYIHMPPTPAKGRKYPVV